VCSTSYQKDIVVVDDKGMVNSVFINFSDGRKLSKNRLYNNQLKVTVLNHLPEDMAKYL